MGSRIGITSYVYLFLLLNLFLPFTLHSQALSLRTYDSGDGLIRSMVISIYQDSRGFLWVGTSDGLARFDGTEFHTYTTVDGLANNYINEIIEDRNGSIWIATAAGLSRYEEGKFTSYVIEDGLPSNSVLSLLPVDDTIWIGTGDGISSFAIEDRDVVSVNTNYGLEGMFVRALLLDSRQRVWAGTDRGLYYLSGDEFLPYMPEQDKLHIQIHDMTKGKNGTLWIASMGDGVVVVQENGILTQYTRAHGLPSNRVVAITRDRNDYIWAGTFGGGAIRISPDGDRKIISTEQGLRSSTVRTVTEDKEGNIWFGTHNGLTRFTTDAIQYYTTEHGLSGNMVTTILQDNDGAMWFGTYGSGVSVLRDGEFDSYTTEDGLPFNVIRALHQSRDGTIWIATHRGVSKYSNGRFINYSEKEGLPYHVILSMLEDRNRRMWFGTYGGGVSVFNHNEFRTFTHENGVGSNVVYTIDEDDEGVLWFGTNCGVARKMENSSRYYHVEDGLPSDTVRAILVDDEGVWFCTDRGIAFYDEGSLISYTTEDGLADNRCRFMIFDDNKDLWIGTNRGVSRFDGVSFQNYNVEASLHTNEMNTNAAYKDSEGNLWFGTAEGIIRIIPEHMPTVEIPPPVYITGTRVYDEEYPTTQPLDLKHNENNVQISFVGLHLSAPEATTYHYKLVGMDSDWKETQIGTVNYPSLRHGEYTFKVVAVNKEGIESVEPATFSFAISPPFWLSWWFLTLGGLAIIGIAVAVHRYRLSKVLELQRLRTRIASDLHDDVGSTLTKISLYSELVHDEEDREKMQNRAKIIGTMTREVISTLGDVVWSIDARNDTVENLVKRMKEFAHTVLSVQGVSVSFRTVGLNEKKRLPLQLRQNLFLVFKEAINNVARHSKATEVKIELRMDNSNLIMRIQDDGIGLHPDPNGCGHGLRNMDMRAKDMNGELLIVNKKGTNITIKVPAQ